MEKREKKYRGEKVGERGENPQILETDQMDIEDIKRDSEYI